MRRTAYLHALALRYCLIGAAASHRILQQSERNERLAFLERLPAWSDFVEEHVRWDIGAKLPVSINASTPSWLARQATEPFQVYMTMQRRGHALDDCLRAVCDDYMLLCANQIRREWPIFRRGKALESFIEVADESMMFAQNFFQRRIHELEEVAEIALLGE